MHPFGQMIEINQFNYDFHRLYSEDKMWSVCARYLL